MLLQQAPAQAPIVVDVIRQPEVTPAISYGGVLLSAVTMVGLILLAAVAVGMLVGGVFIFFRKRSDARSQTPPEPTHVRLQI